MPDSQTTVLERAQRLNATYAGLDGSDLLAAMIRDEFPGRIAIVSSFGAEAAVILHMTAQVDPATPVIFLDTGKHFPETIAYRAELTAHLGLRDVRVIRPDAVELSRADPDGTMWQWSHDRCCHIRKVRPLRRALDGFDAWVTGRKRSHGGARTALPLIEAAEGRIKINPLAAWSPGRVKAEFRNAGLPRHPLASEGFASIGCATCTVHVAPGAAPRSGRWAGTAKTECGIHRSEN